VKSIETHTSGFQRFLAVCALLAVFAAPSQGAMGYGAGGIPGLILTSDLLANFSDFSSAYLNPALLTGIDQGEFNAGINTWGKGSGTVWSPKYLTVSLPLDLDHTVALSFMQVGLSGIQRTDNKGIAISGQYTDYSEIALQASYAYRLLPMLSVGANATMIRPTSTEVGAFGFTTDLGIRFHPIDDYLLGKFSLGLNLQNIYFIEALPDTLSGEFNKYPLNIHMQVHWYNEYYRPFFERFEVSFNCAVMDLITEAQNFGDPASTERISNAADAQAALRAKQEQVKNISFVYGVHAKWFPFKFFGIGSGIKTNGVIPIGISFNWKRINFIKRFQLDYDFGYATENEQPNDSKFSHVVRLGFRFGKTREEAVSERWYRQLMREPQNDFNEAMRLYLAKKYWLASFAFGKVIAKWPSFSKVDVATFYMGKSYEYLHMYDVAREIYSTGLKKYTTSDFRPKFIFQIQNLDYKTMDFENALKNYGFIMNLYKDSDIAPDADYVAGQIYYDKKDHQDAINVLATIDQTNENYLYAQYTLAMIEVHRKNLNGALEYLNNIISVDSLKTISEKSLRELAFVKMGHIFFEQGNLKNAYGCYSRVSNSSRFYDEALLGLAWTNVKGGVPEAYTKAIQTADNLISARPQSSLVAEAYLLMGYGFTLLEQYDKAVPVYKKCIEICDAKYLSRDEFQARESQHSGAMNQYNDFQKKALNIALRKPTPALVAQKDAMTPEWQKFDEEIRNFDVFQIDAQKQFSFKRSSIQLKNQAEYALATALHLQETQKKRAIMRDTQDKTKQIDKEMEDLQKQLKEMEE